MSLLCFGLNHQSAPLPVLEKVAFPPGAMQDFLQGLRGEAGLAEVAGLSTCNRTEFYAVASNPADGREVLLQAIAHAREDACPGDLHLHSYTLVEDEAARHLFRVASGVDSLIIGETQILGQIRRAYEMALGVGSLGGMLNALMMRAIGFGRRVRLETNIGKGNVSTASVAVRRAGEALGSLAGKSLLLLGAGETARTAARHFRSAGVGAVTVCNRTRANAADLVAELGARLVGVDLMQSAIAEADVVVCAVGAPHYIVTPEGMKTIMEERPDRNIALIDLSMPRNIDPEVRSVEGVHLTSLEDLEDLARENRDQRMSEIALVESLIERETLQFLHWSEAGDTTRLITAIRRRADRLRRLHIERYCRQMPQDQREEMARFGDSLLRTVLHDLTLNLRSMDTKTESGARDFRQLCRLFNIDPETMEETPES